MLIHTVFFWLKPELTETQLKLQALLAAVVRP